MEREYGQRYRELYQRHWWWRAREAKLAAELAALAPPGGFGPILDVGCGDGLAFELLSRFGTPEGVESDPELVTAEGRRKGTIHTRPLETLPVEPRFGLVTLLDVLEHVDDDAALLAGALRLLRPGGGVLITVPALPVLWTRHDDVNHHRRRYTRRSIRRLAERSGLAIERLEYFFGWLAAPKLLLHFLERLRAPAGSPLPGLPPEPWNRRLIRFCRVEEKLLGGRLPFGGSLLVVGRSGAPPLQKCRRGLTRAPC